MLIVFGTHTKYITLLTMPLNNHTILIDILNWTILDIIIIEQYLTSNYDYILLR